MKLDSYSTNTSDVSSLPFVSFRWRYIASVLVLFLFSFLLAFAVQCRDVFERGQLTLDASLTQTVTVFRYNVARDFDVLTNHAKATIIDPHFIQYRENLKYAQVGTLDREILEESYQDYLERVLIDSKADILILLDKDCKAVSVASSTQQASEQNNAELSEALTEAEGKDSVPESNAPPVAQGTTISNPLVSSCFSFGENQIGYLRFSEDSPLYQASLVPLGTNKDNQGLFIIAKKVTDATLAKWGQGDFSGIIAVVSGKKIVTAYDKRSARRPSPAVYSVLEEGMQHWEAPAPVTVSNNSPDTTVPPEELELAGSKWKEFALAMPSGSQKEPAGWIIFLADTSPLDYELQQQLLFSGLCLVILVPLLFLVTWKLSSWVAQPYGGPQSEITYPEPQLGDPGIVTTDPQP